MVRRAKDMRSIITSCGTQLGLEHTKNAKLIAYGNLEFAKNYAVEKVGNSIEVVYELPKLCGNVDAQCDHVHMETCAIVPGE